MARLWKTLLPVRRPYDFARSVLSYGYWELPPYRWDADATVLRRAERLNGRIYLLEFRQGPHRSRSLTTVALSVYGEPVDPRGVRAPLNALCRRLLRLDENLGEFYALCRGVPWLKPVPRLGVGRLIRGTSLWEDVVKTIAWTNTTWRQAVKMIGRIGTLGDSCPAAPDLSAWPTPGQLLAGGPDFLKSEAKLGYRAAFLLELARRVEEGALDLEALETSARSLPSSLLAKRLMAIKGVGPASAAYLLTMLGHYDHLILDSATSAHLAHTFFHGKAPTRSQLERLFAPLERWQGLGLWLSFWLSKQGR